MPPKPPFNGSRDRTKWWAVYTKLRTVVQYLKHTLGTECVRMHSTFLSTVYYSGGLYTYVHTYVVKTTGKANQPADVERKLYVTSADEPQ